MHQDSRDDHCLVEEEEEAEDNENAGGQHNYSRRVWGHGDNGSQTRECATTTRIT